MYTIAPNVATPPRVPNVAATATPLFKPPGLVVASLAIAVVVKGGRLLALLSLSQLGRALQPMPEHVRRAGKHLDFVQLAQVEEEGSRQSNKQLLLPHCPRLTQQVEHPDENPRPSTQLWKHEVPH